VEGLWGRKGVFLGSEGMGELVRGSRWHSYGQKDRRGLAFLAAAGLRRKNFKATDGSDEQVGKEENMIKRKMMYSTKTLTEIPASSGEKA